MSDYKGDFAEDATVTMTFNTFDSSGGSITITDLATTDVFVYKDGVVLADPDAGVSLTLNAGTGDGAHILKVDMSSDAQYVTSADYEVKFEGATVSGQTLNVWIGEWSCENRFDEVDLTKIHGSALTETTGQLAAAFTKLFDVATPTLVASDVMRGTDGANTTVPDAAGTAPTVDEIWAKAMSDLPQGAPSATASAFTGLNFIYEAWRNKSTTTATLVTVFKDDGTTALVKSTIADNGTTFTKDEFITGA